MNTLYYTFNPWWEGKDFEAGIDRTKYRNSFPVLLKRKQIEVIIGSRRTGKTTLSLEGEEHWDRFTFLLQLTSPCRRLEDVSNR